MARDSVVVFGSSQAPRDSPHHRLAGELGAALARRGAVVRCGGYGGVMEAVASGAKSAGGRVVGCTLKWFAESRTALLRIPSVIVPRASNFLLNPMHSDARQLTISSNTKVAFDERLFPRRHRGR